jgi:hypothetical protein
MADTARAARGTDDRHRLTDEPVLQVGQVRVNAGRPQLYSTSSPSPTGNSGRGRLRIRNRWTSTARKPDLNRSLTTGLDTSPVIANTDTARNNPHVTLSDYTHLPRVIR